MHFQNYTTKLLSWLAMIVIIILHGWSCSSKKEDARVLVFTKTAGYYHESIPAGIEAIKKLGGKYHFSVDTTNNAAAFHEENLKRYKAVIFLSTTGNVLNQEQQNDFERFIQAGGGFVGIHAASDTEYHWPWYGKLVGAYFLSHPLDPNVQKGTFYVVDKNHAATDSIPERWERSDEFYNFKDINPDIKVLIKIDEKTYIDGKNGDDHPMSWYHDFDGGRAFYTNMGHTNETFSEPLFLKHLWGGIQYAINGDDLDYSKAHSKRVPEENRFTIVTLDAKLEEPVELAVLPDNKVLFIERRGNVKLYDPSKNATEVIAKIPVSTKYQFKDNGRDEAEDGLLGLAIDPKFNENHWVYLYYSPAGDDPKNILTRYEFKNDDLVEESKKVILEVNVQRQQCCHTGGSIAFDGKGNLYVSTGDNTSPRSTAYAPIDERPGRMPWDAQKGSSNTNDLRGKVLRIHPEPDGTYTIPDGNLFPKGMEKTRPEIYTMGARNPYRISVDKRTGFLYWGDVGPDAGKDSVNRGPRAHDEINQARKAGFFGWPYFVGDNRAYYERDFATNTPGPIFDANKPINTSVNNTGLTELPPAQKAFIWYPYEESTDFPLVGKGGRTAMAGPVFYSDDFKGTPRAFPDYYDRKLFIYEWMRGWVMAVTMNEQGDYVSMEQFMPSHKFANPMDMEFGPDGDLYMLEYGTAWFQGNDDARLLRIEYNGGNRKPNIVLTADKTKGATPLAVKFSSAGTKDYDHDEIKYEWKIALNDGTDKTFTEPNASFTFEKPGIYKATLTVTDVKGEQATSSIEIQAGNEPPALTFDIEGNQTFFFPGQPFSYAVKVNDKEDGNSEAGSITAEQISVSIDYLKEGYDKIEIAQGHMSADAMAQFATGKKLMEQSDCKACHIIDKKSIGPMYLDIAKKYKDDPKAVDHLVKKIINGGGGVWGETPMAAHPQLPPADVKEIVNYVLSLGKAAPPVKSLPIQGTYTPVIPKDVSNRGVFILRASYSDKGSNGIPPITSEKTMVLRSNQIAASDADETNAIFKFKMANMPTELMVGRGNNSFLRFNSIDLSGVDEIVCTALAQLPRTIGGVIEVHIDSPTGPLIGKSSEIVPTPAPAKGATTPPALQMPRVKLTPTTGKHAVYVIYRNEKIPDQALFVLLNLEFVSKKK